MKSGHGLQLAIPSTTYQVSLHLRERIWLQRPLFVVKKIAREMAIFYAPLCPVYRQTKFLPLTDEYDREVTYLGKEPYGKVWTAYPPAVESIARAEVLARTAPIIQQPAYIRKPLSILARTYLIMLLIALGLSTAVLLQLGQRRRLGRLAALVLVLGPTNGGNKKSRPAPPLTDPFASV